MARMAFATRICAFRKCQVKFTPKRVNQIYHKPSCRIAAWTGRHPRKKPKATSNDEYLFGRPTPPEERLALLVAAARGMLA